MSTDADLAGWGEPPATPAEDALGVLLDKVLTRIERGKAVKPEALRGDRPELVKRGQELVRAVGLLYTCAASVWENSMMQPNDDPGDLPRFSSAGQPGTIGEKPVAQEVGRPPSAPAVGDLPDPFPAEFRILRVLGEGAFGRVLLAQDLNLGWQVALKTLKLPATSTLGPHVLAALRNEARYLAQLDHPNIVRVHAWREVMGEYFLVLQFVSGGSLGGKLKAEKALGWQDAARYVADVGDGLIAAHERGVIHRDIKPDNILWDAARDEALLTDFGVSARLADPGSVAGSPMYMAPEAFGGQVSPALDVYSLAATFYHLATGEFPFEQMPLHALMVQKLEGLRNPDPPCAAIPEGLERIVRAGMAGRPEDRPKMADFVSALRCSLNQLLADSLVPPSVKRASNAPANLRLAVGRRVQDGTYEPVATIRPMASGLSRDMKKVPPPPEQVRLRSGDRVRVEVVADKAGYVTVFNIGPTGNLNLLSPEDPSAPPTPVEANRPLHVVDVEMTPPVGRERVFVVWSKGPLPLRLEQLLSIAECGGATKPRQSTRDMKRVQQSIASLPNEGWNTVVLELNHINT